MPATYSIHRLAPQDNPGVARLIRTVMPEFGASGAGFAINDPEVDDMHSEYTKPRCAYFVVRSGEQVVGGGGIAPLAGGDGLVCELRKMYFLPELRGKGFGQILMDLCLNEARQAGFKRCYLETLASMAGAQKLYLKNGFERLEQPLGQTGHFSCDVWYARAL